MAKGHTRWRGQSVEVLVYVGDGRYKSRSVRWQGTKKATQDAADRKLRELLAEVEEGNHQGPDVTVAQLVTRWRRFAEPDWSPATTAAYDSYLRNHILPVFGARKVGDIRAADLDDFYSTLRAKKLSPASIGKVHVILRRAFSEAVRWGWIKANPALSARPPKVQRAELKPPTPTQVTKLLTIAAKNDSALFAFLSIAADTGARRGELCGLRWDQVDLKTGEIVIDRAVVIAPGGVVEKDTKTHQIRRVALGAPCAQALTDHRAKVVERALAVGTRPAKNGYVFARDLEGHEPWRPDGVTHRFIKLRNAAKMPKVRLHDLRHALVSDWLAAGVDSRTVMGRVGHASLQTLTRYAHFQQAADRDAAQRLGGRHTAG